MWNILDEQRFILLRRYYSTILEVLLDSFGNVIVLEILDGTILVWNIHLFLWLEFLWSPFVPFIFPFWTFDTLVSDSLEYYFVLSVFPL